MIFFNNEKYNFENEACKVNVCNVQCVLVLYLSFQQFCLKVNVCNVQCVLFLCSIFPSSNSVRQIIQKENREDGK